MSKTANKQPASIENVFKLDGRVPLGKAIPFGLQHILAMFVANLTPITIIAAASGLDNATLAVLLQNAMIAAGLATFIQLYPIWKIGSGLPVVMGVSFTFVAVLSSVGGLYGYGAVVGAVMVGGVVEGCLGLCAKYWRKLITPVVAGAVVTGIGLSLFTVGVRSFGGGYNEDFGSWQNLLIATITLATCLTWNALAKGYLKQISVSGRHNAVEHIYSSCNALKDICRSTYAHEVSWLILRKDRAHYLKHLVHLLGRLTYCKTSDSVALTVECCCMLYGSHSEVRIYASLNNREQSLRVTIKRFGCIEVL